MNLPNKLTLSRIVLVPFFVAAMLIPTGWEEQKWVALTIFIVASLTDYADGKIARSRGLVTNFGKFMDPLADKLLVCSALICLSSQQRLSAWITVIIIAREFIISGFRLLASVNCRFGDSGDYSANSSLDRNSPNGRVACRLSRKKHQAYFGLQITNPRLRRGLFVSTRRNESGGKSGRRKIR